MTTTSAGQAPRLYRPKQAASTLGISKATLYRMIKRGELELVKIGRTRSSGILAESVNAMLERARTAIDENPSAG